MIDQFYEGQMPLPKCDFCNREEDMTKAYDEDCRKRGLERNKEINDLLRKCIEAPIKEGWLLPEKGIGEGN